MKQYFKKLYLAIFIQIIFTMLYSISLALIPALNKHLFDNVLTSGYDFILKLIALYIILIILNSLFQYISRLYEWIVTKEFCLSIKSDLFLAIASRPYYKYKEKSPSDYLALFNNNVETIAEDYISAYIDLFKSILNILIFASALLIFVDIRIAALVFILSIVVTFIPRLISKKLSLYKKDQLTALGSYFNKLINLFSGKKRINSHSIDAFISEHSQSLNIGEKKRLQFGKLKTISDILGALGVFFIEISTFALVAYLLINKEISIGTGIAAFGYVTSFLNPIRNILECINCINSTKETVNETMSYLSQEPMLGSLNTPKNLKVKSLSLKDIYYEVGDFSLSISDYTFVSAKKYAIRGHSGSGKSSLMRIIDGTNKLSNGLIHINDKDICDINIEDYIFSLDQFEHLFDTNFINNVTLFNSVKDESKLNSKLLNRLSSKTREKITNYDSVSNLSGGEKQIIALLRMLASNKPIILLDESFSSIDKANTKLIKDYLMSLEDKIIIEVSHDISKDNLERYDHVLCIEDGVLINSPKYLEKSYNIY